MRFMVLIKADPSTEAGQLPSEQLLAEMGRFNEELVKAGVMLSGEGLQPSSKGARVRFSGAQRTVVDGPFVETKELIAGFWIWQVGSKQEALDWIRRCPNPTGTHGEIELRQIFEAEDFGAEFTPELREQEERLRTQLAAAQVPAVQPVVAAVPAPQGATPYLVVKGAAAAIDFYEQAFEARLVMRVDAPNGALMHAELKVGPASFMLTEECAQYGALSPLTIGGSGSSATIYVPDVDAAVARCVAAGAKIDMPLQDQFWGDRSASITDPFGHKWMVATHLEDPSAEQIQQRIGALFSSQQR